VKVTLSVAKNESLIEKDLKMKTFIVYDLDSKMPVAVGEQVTAETARYCASVVTGIFHANLFAEEIDLENLNVWEQQPPQETSYLLIN
jgi:hypothetical protein